MSELETALLARSSTCELCGSDSDLAAWAVSPPRSGGAEDAVLACGTCREQLAGDAPLDAKHWFGLQESIWSEVGAVQVVSWRVLDQLRAETWAGDVLESAYLDDELMSWARAQEPTSGIQTVDSNGTVLADGDSVTLIKDLDVKGANFTAKRGTLVKNIRLSDDPGLVEGRVNKTAIFLKTEFLKKA